MVAESDQHPASKLLLGVPTLGAVGVAQLISVVATPHRFRTKRQFWSYCGLAVQTHSSADYRFEGSEATARDEEGGDARPQAGS